MKAIASSPSAQRPTSRRVEKKVVKCAANDQRRCQNLCQKVGAGVVGLAASFALGGMPATAEIRLPPIDSDPNRCERGFVGNTIGQANAVSDKILDLRKCVYVGKDLTGKTWAGALLSEADLTDSNLREIVLSKAYAVGANFEGADLTNAVLDRVDFSNASLKNAKLVNAVITGTQFNNTNLEGAVFEDALIGSEDAKRLCANPTLKGDSRFQVGCRVSK